MTRSIAIAVFVAMFSAGCLPAQDAVSVKTPYTGRALLSSGKLTCRAEYAGGTGYYATPEGWERAAEFVKQSRAATWVITLQGDKAQVTDTQGNSGSYTIVKRNGTGIVLVEMVQTMSVQVVTIDPSTSSFVYTTQNASGLWNRATTWTGEC